MPDQTTLDIPTTRTYAQVAVDVSLAHLDRPFDYVVPADLVDQVRPGVRVRVRFAGRLRDGFVVGTSDTTEHDRVQPLERLVSAEPVLTEEVTGLVRAVADHYLGTFADVVRLAVPTRHGRTEQAQPRSRTPVDPERLTTAGPVFEPYRGGPEFLAALGRGASPRAAWQVLPRHAGPVADWAAGFAAAAAATHASGRGSLLIVPDQRDLARLTVACAERFGDDGFVVLTAELGPAARYRAFLAALRGQVRVVIGTRAAAFAPVADLGLVALWDDGDDVHAEPRAPYPHVREVLALRAGRIGAAALFAGHGRTAEVAELVRRDWLRDLVADREAVRRAAPLLRIAADSERALDRDPAARAARLPRDVFEVIRTGLAAGPVLVQVPRAGYLAGLVCRTCREPLRCGACQGSAVVDPGHGVRCRQCGRDVPRHPCPECGDDGWRAPVVGAVRTGEELGKAFPQTVVHQSSGDRVLDEVPDTPSLVVATPGAEPYCRTGYAAAVLLDTTLLLQRADLRAAEEALRRWWNATALVVGGAAGGSVIAVGPAESAALQAFLRLDPVTAAERELGQRDETGFPPAGRMVALEGAAAVVEEVADQVGLDRVTRWGPVEAAAPKHSEEAWVRLSLVVERSRGNALVRAVRDVMATRTARKDDGTVRIRVDPQVIG
ncbi:primosome assembly protein PriA [Microlunatus sp. Y2014]|uniref:primosomal protein N' family DNA-binding protein n=1 Tax=Microlunatus sp. Y2014 TaxID=3418488 RepID=UPI003DA72025